MLIMIVKPNPNSLFLIETSIDVNNELMENIGNIIFKRAD